jgi:hypothetical protein
MQVVPVYRDSAESSVPVHRPLRATPQPKLWISVDQGELPNQQGMTY